MLQIDFNAHGAASNLWDDIKCCDCRITSCEASQGLSRRLYIFFAGLSRWQRISLVRDLANAKLQDGDSTVSARYARERKHSALELLEKSRHKARDIFDRQVRPLLHCSAYAHAVGVILISCATASLQSTLEHLQG